MAMGVRYGVIQALNITSPATITSTGYATDETNLATYTFNGVGIGTAAADRIVFAVVQLDRNGAITATTTCNGVSMTNLAQANGASGFQLIQIYALSVTTGTTANFIVTGSGACNRGAIWTFAAYGLVSLTPVATYIGTGVNPQTFGSVTVNAGGFGLFAASIQNTGGSPITWSGTASPVSNGTNLEGTTGTYMSTAQLNGAASGSVTATPNSAGSQATVGVSMR